MDAEQTGKPNSDKGPPGSTQSVSGRLKELLGFRPGIQLRNLTTESDLSLTPDEGDGKYVLEREIGRGGMGRVHLAFDRDLRRRVAIKVVSPDLAASQEHLARFVEEAQVTGQLEHPGIPPVHEIALNDKGEVFFTLKLLKGRTLKDIVQDLHIRRRETRERFSQIRLLMILQAVCNAVHFAHEKGVVHRDIKPENIMIGDYGEVQLMDWGLAKVLDAEEREPLEEQVETNRSDQQLVTMAGQVYGTLQYMAPEQAEGRSELIDRGLDVYALGSTLYEILTFVPPRTGRTISELLEECRMGLVTLPSVRAPKFKIPPALEEICMTAMELRPEDRYQTALEMSEAIQNYIDGSREAERKRTEAERCLAQAAKVLREHRKSLRHLEELKRRYAEASEADDGRPSPDEKKRSRQLQSELHRQEIDVARKYTEAQTLLAAALSATPENPNARRALGELYLERFKAADAADNATDVIFYGGLIEQVNDGHFDEVLRGDGSIELRTEPDGATFTVYRYQEEDEEEVRWPEEQVARQTGRLELPDLPMGSYVVVIELPGFATTRYPIHVRRNRRVSEELLLYPESAIPAGFVPVCTGTPVGPPPTRPFNPLLTETRWIPNFAISIHPVVCQDYLAFLNDLAKSDPSEAQRRAPRVSPEAGFLWQLRNKRFELPAPDEYAWSRRLPVFGVSFEDAQLYARYRSEQDGFCYDLPRGSEWEKAARGADHRDFSWGNQIDNEYFNGAYAREGKPGAVDVDRYETDCSPYGVRGVVGNVGDWCHLETSKASEAAGVRGANWALAGQPCKLGVERAAPHTYVADRIGFRLVVRLV